MLRALLLLPILVATVLAAIVATPLSNVVLAASSHPPLEFDRRCAPRVRVIPGQHAQDREADQLRIVCRNRQGEVADIGFPAGWVRFLTRHVDRGQLTIGGEAIDLVALWAEIEGLDQGEELLIEDGDDQARIWIE